MFICTLSVSNWKTITLPQHRPLEERGPPSAEAAAEAALLPGLLRGDGARELAVLAPEEDLLVPLLVRGTRLLRRLRLRATGLHTEGSYDPTPERERN